MTSLGNSDVFFVGSMPASTPDEAFRVCADTVGEMVFALPDGEVGIRRMWIAALGESTWGQHPEIERTDVDHPFSHNFGSFRVKDGVKSIDLVGHLPYAEPTLAAYAALRDLREEGVLAPDVRIQVAFPTAHAATGGYFRDVDDWDVLWPAWNKAVRAEIDKILEVVPASDLAVQLDYCTEFIEMNGDDLKDAWPYDFPKTTEEKFQLFTSPDYIAPLAEGLASETLLGYHICMGTYPRQPLSPINDMSLVVRVSNALVEATPRRVDFFHMPVMADADDKFFEPLRGLAIGDAKVFLGLETGDDDAGIRARISSAEKSLKGFGISHFCGYGRETDESFLGRLAVLREGAKALSH